MHRVSVELASDGKDRATQIEQSSWIVVRERSMAGGADVFGKIKFVENFPDYKVKVVENFADLHVQIVENFPDTPGKWKIVENFPDYKIKLVENFPDFTIKYVQNFPGPQ